jgi:hypothetical protein
MTTQTSEVFERVFATGDTSNLAQALLTQSLTKTSEVLFELISNLLTTQEEQQ